MTYNFIFTDMREIIRTSTFSLFLVAKQIDLQLQEFQARTIREIKSLKE